MSYLVALERIGAYFNVVSQKEEESETDFYNRLKQTSEETTFYRVERVIPKKTEKVEFVSVENPK